MKFIFLIFMVLTLTSKTTFAYELKSLVVSGYSKPWVMIKSEATAVSAITKIRLHLHGWTQDPATGKPFNELFDFSWKDSSIMPSEGKLKILVEGYGMQREVESHADTAIVVPISRGHCDQYPELLNGFDETFSRVLGGFGFNAEIVRLEHVSAHSGGGEYLSRLMTLSPQSRHLQLVKNVSFYDAIYSESTKKNLTQWLVESSSGSYKNLEILNVPGGTPSVKGSELFNSLMTAESKKMVEIESTKMLCREKTHHAGNVIQLIEENKRPTLLDHWTLVKALWLFTCPEVKRIPSSKKSSR